MCSRGLPSLRGCVLISTSQKDARQIRDHHPTSFYPLLFWKTLSPNTVPFWGRGVWLQHVNLRKETIQPIADTSGRFSDLSFPEAAFDQLLSSKTLSCWALENYSQFFFSLTDCSFYWCSLDNNLKLPSIHWQLTNYTTTPHPAPKVGSPKTLCIQLSSSASAWTSKKPLGRHGFYNYVLQFARMKILGSLNPSFLSLPLSLFHSTCNSRKNSVMFTSEIHPDFKRSVWSQWRNFLSHSAWGPGPFRPPFSASSLSRVPSPDVPWIGSLVLSLHWNIAPRRADLCLVYSITPEPRRARDHTLCW